MCQWSYKYTYLFYIEKIGTFKNDKIKKLESGMDPRFCMKSKTSLKSPESENREFLYLKLGRQKRTIWRKTMSIVNTIHFHNCFYQIFFARSKVILVKDVFTIFSKSRRFRIRNFRIGTARTGKLLIDVSRFHEFFCYSSFFTISM